MNNTLQAHEAPDVCDPAGYHIWREDPVRFNDLDPHWHMTSISFMIIFESSRIRFVQDASASIDKAVAGWMLVNANVTYRAQVLFPSTLRVGTRLHRMGSRSVTTVQAMFNGDECCATLESTLVLVDKTRNKAIPLTDELKARLQSLSDTGSL